jgi:GNAT superfamily N-acetyltransferase
VTIVLRPLREDDEAELRRIHETPEVARWWGMPEPGFPWSDEPDSTRMAIELDGVLAGMIQFWEEPTPRYRHATIDLFLDPALRGRGIGGEAVAQLARELFAFIGCEFALLPVERVRLVAAQDFFDQRLRACSSLFAGEVDFLGGERALDAHTHEFARVGYDLRHGSATSSVSSFGAGGISMRLRSRGSGATGRNSCSSRRASVRV